VRARVGARVRRKKRGGRTRRRRKGSVVLVGCVPGKSTS